MTAYFFESSAFVKRFAKERGTNFVLRLLRPSTKNRYYASQLTEVEVCAALARRRKGKTLSAAQVSKSQRRFARDFADRFTKILISDTIISEALRLADFYELRGYDAVQLACAIEANRDRLTKGLTALMIVSADNELNDAAQAEGLAVENPNNYL